MLKEQEQPTIYKNEDQLVEWLKEDLEDITLIDEAKATSTKRYSLDEANEILNKYDNGELTDEDINII